MNESRIRPAAMAVFFLAWGCLAFATPIDRPAAMMTFAIAALLALTALRLAIWPRWVLLIERGVLRHSGSGGVTQIDMADVSRLQRKVAWTSRGCSSYLMITVRESGEVRQLPLPYLDHCERKTLDELSRSLLKEKRKARKGQARGKRTGIILDDRPRKKQKKPPKDRHNP